MTVTLIDVLAAARARCASLVGELAGYLVLGVADQVAAAPRRVAAADVALGPDGAVALVGGSAASERTAETALRDLLKQLLVNASSASPALSRASHGPCGRGVAALVRELEASLIPVNRAAGKRAATRLYRETKRALDEGVLERYREQLSQSQHVETQPQASPDAPAEIPVAEARQAKRDVAAPRAEAAPASPRRAPAADGLESSGDAAPDEFSGAHHVEIIVESSVPPAPVVPRQASALPHSEPQPEPLQRQCAPVEEDVTRPEPLVRNASRRPVPDLALSDGRPSTRDRTEQQVALTPPLGSIAALETATAVDDGQRGLAERVAAVLDADHTDPMHQGEYLEISESLRNCVAGVDPEEDESSAADQVEPSCPAHVIDPAPAAQAREPGEATRTASSRVPADPQEVRPAFGPDSPRREYAAESPPWVANATAALFPRAEETGVSLRDPEWLWPELSPAPPAPELAPPPAATRERSPASAAAGAALAARPAAVMSGQTSAEGSFPPDDGWDVPHRDGAAASALRAARASSALSPRRSQVEELLESFSVADQREDDDVCRDLKQMAGLDLTPPPGAAVGEE